MAAERPTSRHRSLDGLRALALALVLAYHLGVPGFGGGFVGVDLFFVLSGYLITSLLVDEHGRTGGVSLRAFWARRVRRLWPLSWITLCLVALAGLVGVWNADQRSTLPGQTAAATAQVANCINDVLKPKGVAVVIEAAHQCMTTRGIHKPGVSMVTSRMLGAFRDDPSTRREFLAMISGPRGGVEG